MSTQKLLVLVLLIVIVIVCILFFLHTISFDIAMVLLVGSIGFLLTSERLIT